MKILKYYLEDALPQGSKRRQIYETGLTGWKVLVIEGWRCFFWNARIYILKLFSKKNSKNIPGDDIGEHEKDLFVCRHPIAMTFTRINAKIDLKKGYNMVRFHLPEAGGPHCSIPEIKTDEGRCLDLQVKEMTVRCESIEPSLDLGDNWHWVKEHNGSSILCMNNDATITIWVEKDSQAKLGLQAMSLNQSRDLELYTKAIKNKTLAKKFGNSKYILMKEAAPRPIADIDIIKSKLDEIKEKSKSEI
jgi:hypothetical protein